MAKQKLSYTVRTCRSCELKGGAMIRYASYAMALLYGCGSVYQLFGGPYVATCPADILTTV